MTSSGPNCDFEAFKNKGNEHFKSKNYPKALLLYTDAIAAKGDEAIAYSNRAICLIHLKRYYEAIEDCDKALIIDKNFIKAYYRRALAQRELFRFKKALNDYEKVLELDPSFVIAKEEISKLKKLLATDPRIDVTCYPKPDRFKSTTEIQEFELRNQYMGSKKFSINK